jgi:hypothetical protein
VYAEHEKLKASPAPTRPSASSSNGSTPEGSSGISLLAVGDRAPGLDECDGDRQVCLG